MNKESAAISLADDPLYQRLDSLCGAEPFTDCTSFAIMRELKLTTVITTDGHFRQVGFDVLPAIRPRRTRKPRRS